MTKKAWRKGRGAGLACLLLAVSLFVSGQAVEATHRAFAPGDVFVSMQDGTVQWFHPDGTFNAVLPTWFPGSKAEGMGFDASGNLYVTHWSPGNTVEKFNTTGSLQGTFGSGYNCNPNSIVYDAAGNVYVGQKDCAGTILKFDAAGTYQAAFEAAAEFRGTGWIDLAADGCTIFYTSSGVKVKRYNVCAKAQLEDFNAMPLPGFPPPWGMGAQAVRILPDGQVLVADDSVIVRLDASGNQVATYDFVGADGWLGLDLVGDGTFWASNFGSGNVVRFDIATGAVLTVIYAGGSNTVKGVAVARAPSAVGYRGRMTGGGSIFTGPADYGAPIGTRITHGFELHCDYQRKPNTLEVNIHGAVAGRYHLTELYSSTYCWDDATIEPNPPAASYDTYEGYGTGSYNGQPGYTMKWKFTDAGEPGTNDRIGYMYMWDPNGNPVLGIHPPGYRLTFGNHQAHK